MYEEILKSDLTSEKLKMPGFTVLSHQTISPTEPNEILALRHAVYYSFARMQKQCRVRKGLEKYNNNIITRRS